MLMKSEPFCKWAWVQVATRGYKLAVETSDIIFDLAQAVTSLASSLAKQLNYMREVAREFPDKIGKSCSAVRLIR